MLRKERERSHARHVLNLVCARDVNVAYICKRLYDMYLQITLDENGASKVALA